MKVKGIAKFIADSMKNHDYWKFYGGNDIVFHNIFFSKFFWLNEGLKKKTKNIYLDHLRAGRTVSLYLEICPSGAAVRTYTGQEFLKWINVQQ